MGVCDRVQEMNDASVLVGIVTRNRPDLVCKAIDSALAQKGHNIQVAVLDDGSADDMAVPSPRFPNVRWTKWPQSRGYMAARNYLMSNATEDYFVSLDDDAWFLDGDEIQLASDAIAKDPRTGAIAFDILSPDKPERRPRDEQQRVACFIGCGHMLRLSAVREVGEYEAVPGIYGGEEKDLCLRLMDAGYEILRLNGVHVWHDKTQVARQIPVQHRSGVCNDLVMTVRRTPFPLLPAALLSKFYRHLLFAVRNNLLSPALAGFAFFLKSLPETWQSRKPVKISTLRAFMKLRA